MTDGTSIEWTDATLNPLRARNRANGKVGWHCEHKSEGCRFCYAEPINRRLGTGLDYKPGHRDDVEHFVDDKILLQPLRWRRPRKVFISSTTDIFGEWVTDEQLDRIFAMMALAPQHTFQVLTKRAERMRAYLGACVGDQGRPLIGIAVGRGKMLTAKPGLALDCNTFAAKPIPNVWLGVSCEDQETADERIPLLLQTPAAARFISAEPLLGPIDLTNLDYYATLKAPRVENDPNVNYDALRGHMKGPDDVGLPKLDWVIVGGESGPRARPMHPNGPRSLRDQCAAAGVAFFFKQWGEFLPLGQHLTGCGKVHGATAVRPGRMKLHCGGSPKQEPMHAFAERGVVFSSTADGYLTFRVGKKRAGRLLDGVEYSAFPEVKA